MSDRSGSVTLPPEHPHFGHHVTWYLELGSYCEDCDKWID